MLEVGVNTFISVEDADTYINENFADKKDMVEKWKALTTEQKEACLRRNTQVLNRLRYIGREKTYSQPLKFPRVNNVGVGGYIYVPFISQFYDNQHISASGTNPYDIDGMKAIGRATVLNALYEVYYSEAIDETVVENIKGITSKKIGPISETYNRNNTKMYSVETGIYTVQVERELADWLVSSRLSL